MSIDKDLLDRLMEGRSPGDLFGKTGILAELTKALAERALSTEIDVHLDEERAEEAPEGQNHPPNRRNGRSQKTVTTDSGKVVLDIPRDRNGTFDPLLIAKYQRRFPEFDRKIVSMYARGMTTREIQGHIEEIYGVEASPGLISAITDAVMEEVTAWQMRSRWWLSIAKIRLALATSSWVNGFGAAESVPADTASMPGKSLNTSSAVGLLSLLAVQTNRTFIHGSISPSAALRNPTSSAFGKIADPHQFHLVLGMQRIGVRHILWPPDTAIKA